MNPVSHTVAGNYYGMKGEYIEEAGRGLFLFFSRPVEHDHSGRDADDSTNFIERWRPTI